MSKWLTYFTGRELNKIPGTMYYEVANRSMTLFAVDVRKNAPKRLAGISHCFARLCRTGWCHSAKRVGKDHQLITLRDEDYWLSRGETRNQMLYEAIRFIQQHNPAN